MNHNTIEEEIDFLYQQKKEIIEEKEFYLTELKKIDEKNRYFRKRLLSTFK